MKFEDIDFTDLKKARAQITENYAALVAEVLGELNPGDAPSFPVEPMKTTQYQPNEPGNNPRPTREETETNPSQPGIPPSKPGKHMQPKPR